MLSDDDLARLRANAEGNPSHRGDVILALLAEVERLKRREAERVAECEAILGRLRGRKGTSEEGKLSMSDKIGLLTIAGRWQVEKEDTADAEADAALRRATADPGSTVGRLKRMLDRKAGEGTT